MTFGHTIEIAVATPQAAPRRIGEFVLLGIAVGLVPVALGMLAFPALRLGGARVTAFALALTLGLLGFLFIDTLAAAIENAARAAPGLPDRGRRVTLKRRKARGQGGRRRARAARTPADGPRASAVPGPAQTAG